MLQLHTLIYVLERVDIQILIIAVLALQLKFTIMFQNLGNSSALYFVFVMFD